MGLQSAERDDCEDARHKKYYDQKFKCMKIVPGDLVLVRVKDFGPDHKITDRWEQVPLVYRVQPVNDDKDENICTLHRKKLFPFQSLQDDETLVQDQNVAQINANVAMMEYFS